MSDMPGWEDRTGTVKGVEGHWGVRMNVRRELDALIAEKLMGWTEVGFMPNGDPVGNPPGLTEGEPADGFYCVPPHSTSIAAAMEVLSHFDSYELSFNSFIKAKYLCEVTKYSPEQYGRAYGTSALEAIRLAVMKAIGYEVNE